MHKPGGAHALNILRVRLLLPTLYLATSVPITPCAPIDVCCLAFLLLIARHLVAFTSIPSAGSVVLTNLRSVTKVIISDELAPDPDPFLVISDPVPRLTVAFIHCCAMVAR